MLTCYRLIGWVKWRGPGQLRTAGRAPAAVAALLPAIQAAPSWTRCTPSRGRWDTPIAAAPATLVLARPAALVGAGGTPALAVLQQ